MKIYTSYFGNWRRWNGLIPINIALKPPTKGMKTIYELTPTKEILSLKDSPDSYTIKYFNLLDNLDAETILDEIEQLSNKQDCVLLCYEKPFQFCHRHIVADWLKTNLNIEVREI